jgi:hypothetical protein
VAHLYAHHVLSFHRSSQSQVRGLLLPPAAPRGEIGQEKCFKLEVTYGNQSWLAGKSPIDFEEIFLSKPLFRGFPS